LYLEAAEQFYDQYMSDKSQFTTGACNMLLSVGSSCLELKSFQDLYDCHGRDENNFETKYRKLQKKGFYYSVPRNTINEIRLLSLLFASHALES